MNFPFGLRPHFKFIFYVRLLLITCKPCACTKCKPCYSWHKPPPLLEFGNDSSFIKLLERIKNNAAVKKYIANTAENSFDTDKVLIISWPYRCNCTITETSKKRTIQRYLYSPPGRTERQRPAYGGFLNAIVCVSYHQHPIMAEEKRSQESGRVREKT